MKPKKPASRRALGDRTAAEPNEGRRGKAIVLDFIQSRIEAFDTQHGGGVAVRKDAHGYSLFHLDMSTPIARLRPRDSGDRFEVLYWSPFRERWAPVGEFGGVILSLDDALEFIARDPMGCFWR